MADDHEPFHNPFAVLKTLSADLKIRDSEEQPSKGRGLEDSVGVDPDPRALQPEPWTVRSAVHPVKGPARAVVRMERAGRGGKEVTVVEHLGLSATELERWLKDLKAGLGCGGVVEGDALMLQGNHRERLAKLLTARGVKKVTQG
jgi:translation initiation factor 1